MAGRAGALGGLALAFCVCGSSIAAQTPPKELPPEELMVRALPADGRHRIFMNDLAMTRATDTKLSIIDGDTFRYLGSIPSGFLGHFDLSPDRRRLYVATSYYSRGPRGRRTDVLEVWDTQTLNNIGEVILPDKRASGAPVKGLLRVSADERWAFVQNSTPASSVTIVDLKARRVSAEVETAGCWAIVPSAVRPGRFASLCGDGSLLVTDLNAGGTLAGQSSVPGLFDPDTDPAFIHTEAVGDLHYFMTYKGRVLAVDLSTARPTVERAWSLLKPEDEAAGWRPGGAQLFAIHPGSKRLFVSMHPAGFNGSHKEPAKEVWVFDLDARKRLARLDGRSAVALAVTQDAAPKLFLSDPVGRGLIAYDARTLQPAGEQSGLFDFGYNMVVP